MLDMYGVGVGRIAAPCHRIGIDELPDLTVWRTVRAVRDTEMSGYLRRGVEKPFVGTRQRNLHDGDDGKPEGVGAYAVVERFPRPFVVVCEELVSRERAETHCAILQICSSKMSVR